MSVPPPDMTERSTLQITGAAFVGQAVIPRTKPRELSLSHRGFRERFAHSRLRFVPFRDGKLRHASRGLQIPLRITLREADECLFEQRGLLIRVQPGFRGFRIFRRPPFHHATRSILRPTVLSML